MNVKVKTPICRFLPLLCVAVMLSACVNTLELAVPRGAERASVTHEGAVADAKAYFDTHFGISTRSEEQQPTPEAPYVVGNLVPDWESGVMVANEEKSYTDFAIQKDYRFFLALEDEEQRICGFELYSRLASVNDFGLDTLNQFVATYIPDISFLSCYESYKKDNLLTCKYVDWFTGVILYTDLYGYHVAAYKYYDGQLVDSSFLFDRQKSREENVEDFMRVMGGIALFVAPSADESTRSTIEVEDIAGGQMIYWYDENGKLYRAFCNIDGITETRPTLKPVPIIEDDFASTVGINNNKTATITPIIPAGGGGSSSTTTTEEEKVDSKKFADKILRNTLSPSDSIQLHTMLTEILKDCMGQTLLQEIYDKGVKISINFDSNQSNSMYICYGDNLGASSIIMCNNHSEGLVHELFHYYQHYTFNYATYNFAKVNMEVEAHLASLLYMSHETNKGAHSRYNTYLQSTMGKQLDICTEFIDSNGMYKGENDEAQNISMTLFGDYFKDIARDYKNTHKGLLYDETRTIDNNVKCLQTIFKNCD